jgi:type VI secretion system protein ImpC
MSKPVWHRGVSPDDPEGCFFSVPFDEVELDRAGNASPAPHGHYCWMNAAYLLGTRLADAFAKYGWSMAIRGIEGGGRVEGLPVHTFPGDGDEPGLHGPTEVDIPDRRETELGTLGFLALVHVKYTNDAVFLGAQTTQKPMQYDRPEASLNAAVATQLPYVLASSRFAHYLKMMARDKIRSFLELSELQNWLNRWITTYVNSDRNASAETRARFPLAEAKLTVRAVEGKPGSYEVLAFMRPWLPSQELSAALRVVVEIPKVID